LISSEHLLGLVSRQSHFHQLFSVFAFRPSNLGLFRLPLSNGCAGKKRKKRLAEIYEGVDEEFVLLIEYGEHEPSSSNIFGDGMERSRSNSASCGDGSSTNIVPELKVDDAL
jgi:hypothetical protein